MKYLKILKIIGFLPIIALYSCSSFNYKTYDEKANENVEDPEPNYKLTLDEDFQDFTNYMFIGNRVENFGTYFNTYFNAKENFNDAYDDYVSRVLASYNEKRDSIFAKPRLSQESIDKFNKSIEKASKVIQYHKSSVFMDRSVLLIGQSYYYLGDYLKAERKFSEFLSKLSNSKYTEEAQLYLSKTQLRLDNEAPAMERLENLVKTSKDKSIISESYQSIAESYLNKKDYEKAIKNFKKAIEFSNDNEFKAQMQFLVATVTEKSNPKAAAKEYEKVLDYDASYDLEYLAKHNYAKNLVLSGNFGAAKSILADMEVKYKDNVPYLSEINYLSGFYYEQKKDSKNAVGEYFEVIKKYPNTVSSADASFRIANYYESKNDYLNAYRYYKFSTEQSSASLNNKEALSKTDVFKTYFDLRSVITGQQVNTDYDKEFKKNTGGEIIEENEKGDQNRGDEGTGKPGGLRFYQFEDSLKDNSIDSSVVKEEIIAKAKFELAELFLYDLNQPDSCEHYLNQAFNQTTETDFKAKVLFALAALYRTTNNFSKNEDILRQIINDYPTSSVTNASKRLLNLAVVEEFKGDSSDSLFTDSENKFVNKDYEGALNGFKELIRTYPSSIHLDKAMYAAGWIYENVSMKFDSAYYYYSSLMKAVPNSEAAAIVSQKVSEYETVNNMLVDSMTIINDSLKAVDSSKINPTELTPESDPTNQSIDDSQQPPKNKEEFKKEELPPVEEPKKDDGTGK